MNVSIPHNEVRHYATRACAAEHNYVDSRCCRRTSFLFSLPLAPPCFGLPPPPPAPAPVAPLPTMQEDATRALRKNFPSLRSALRPCALLAKRREIRGHVSRNRTASNGTSPIDPSPIDPSPPLTPYASASPCAFLPPIRPPLDAHIS